jgi:uracil phosphoribosyltransferase
MKIINLSDNNSLLNQFLKEIRSVEIQNDSLRFRRNLERIGEIMAYEISKQMAYEKEKVKTPLGISPVNIIKENVVVATILRAGLPLHQGFLNYFDKAENAFVSAFREYSDSVNFDIHIEYIASPDLNNKTLIITDTMLATGSSMELAYKALLTKGKPAKVHIASVLATRFAVDYLLKQMPDDNIILWTAAIDPDLNEHSYIVPGLGDAGDLAFGEKL